MQKEKDMDKKTENLIEKLLKKANAIARAIDEDFVRLRIAQDIYENGPSKELTRERESGEKTIITDFPTHPKVPVRKEDIKELANKIEKNLQKLSEIFDIIHELNKLDKEAKKNNGKNDKKSNDDKDDRK